jgi:hypothetical protein
LGHTDEDLVSASNSSSWKISLAVFLKERTQASNQWLGRRLRIGSAKYVSHLVSEAKRAPVVSAKLAKLRARSDLTP